MPFIWSVYKCTCQNVNDEKQQYASTENFQHPNNEFSFQNKCLKIERTIFELIILENKDKKWAVLYFLTKNYWNTRTQYLMAYAEEIN